MRTRLFGILVLIASLAAVSPAQAERRLALVLGNSDYLVGPLDNPVNDAALITATLEATGFEVTQATNLGYRELQRAIVTFGRELAAAGEDTVGMVYYAGHAVQANGENYLIPVDADLQDELDLDIQTLEVSTLMKSLDRAGNRLNMVVLDACRNNPFKSISRSGTRGLAKVDAPQGTLVAYSTAPGNVALDGTGRNSPYTKALAKVLREPGLPVEQVFKKVRIEVMERTGQQQVPWESSSLTGDFFFQDAVPEPVAVPQPSAPTPQNNPQQAEIAFWTSIATSDDPTLFQSYLQAYPNGLFSGIAEQRIAALQAEQARSANQSREAEALALWESVKASSDPNVLSTLVQRYPNSVYAELAKARIQTLEAQQRAATQQQAATTAQASARPQTDDAGDKLFWQSIQNSPNKSDYEAYLAQYPNGTFAAIARSRAESGYTPQVAALTTETNPYDGTYEIEMRVTNRPWGNPWCQVGEHGKGTITFSNGKGDATLTSSRGGSARFILEVDMNGRVTGTKRVSGWRSPTRKIRLNISSGKDEALFHAQDWCEAEFTIARK